MIFSQNIKINKINISDKNRVFIIAEAGVNHSGKLSLAKKLIDLAADSGVDAIKFQNFKADQLILQNVSKAPYQKKITNPKQDQYSMLKLLEMDFKKTKALKEYCEKKKLLFLSTPFDEKSLNDLIKLNLDAYKISSTDINNPLLLKKIARLNKPIFLSTGMSLLKDVEKALKIISKFNKKIVLLQCTANYPIKDNEANLNVIKTYKKKFKILTGFSDHTSGVGASPYSVAIGVAVIEKHFTLNKSFKGPDHKASLSPKELKLFVKKIRKVEEYLGSYDKKITESEQLTQNHYKNI